MIIVQMVVDDSEKIQREIKAHRLGKYEEGGGRPLKVKLKSQVGADKIKNKTW